MKSRWSGGRGRAGERPSDRCPVGAAVVVEEPLPERRSGRGDDHVYRRAARHAGAAPPQFELATPRSPAAAGARAAIASSTVAAVHAALDVRLACENRQLRSARFPLPYHSTTRPKPSTWLTSRSRRRTRPPLESLPTEVLPSIALNRPLPRYASTIPMWTGAPAPKL
jgi:hypothetical protein